jgi:hypothetical protein
MSLAGWSVRGRAPIPEWDRGEGLALGRTDPWTLLVFEFRGGSLRNTFDFLQAERVEGFEEFGRGLDFF